MRRHRAWMLSVGVLLVAVPLGLGDKPAPAVNPGPVAEGPKPSPTKPEVGRNEAVATIRGLGGAGSLRREESGKTDSPRRLGRN